MVRTHVLVLIPYLQYNIGYTVFHTVYSPNRSALCDSPALNYHKLVTDHSRIMRNEGGNWQHALLSKERQGRATNQGSWKYLR